MTTFAINVRPITTITIKVRPRRVLSAHEGGAVVGAIQNGNETGGVQRIFIKTQQEYDDLKANGQTGNNLYFVPKTT